MGEQSIHLFRPNRLRTVTSKCGPDKSLRQRMQKCWRNSPDSGLSRRRISIQSSTGRMPKPRDDGQKCPSNVYLGHSCPRSSPKVHAGERVALNRIAGLDEEGMAKRRTRMSILHVPWTFLSEPFTHLPSFPARQSFSELPQTAGSCV